MIKNLGNSDSIINHFISEVRDAEIQKDKLRFRRNLERIGEIFAFEISKFLEYEEKEVITSLGVARVPVLKNSPVLATILRAGLPLHQGMLNVFDRAQNAFVSAYRKHNEDGKFEINIEYSSSPDLDGKILIISDPMIATGASMFLAYKELLERGKPKHTHIVSVLASVQGVNYIKRQLSSSEVSLWVGAIDDELTAQAYIVPGLGDAGDLAFGDKI